MNKNASLQKMETNWDIICATSCTHFLDHVYY